MSNEQYNKLKNSFSQLINSNVVSKIESNSIKIEEENSNAKGKGEYVIINRLKDCIPINLDQNESKIYFFNKDVSRNDQTIFYVENNKLYIILIELKSCKKGKGEKQIRYGKVLADFIIDILEKETDIKFDEREYRGYIFTTRNSVKRSPSLREKKFKYDKEVENIYIKEVRTNSKYVFNDLVLPR